MRSGRSAWCQDSDIGRPSFDHLVGAGGRLSARRPGEMANTLCPFFQRSQSSSFCFAVNNIRDVTICHLLIQQD